MGQVLSFVLKFSFGFFQNLKSRTRLSDPLIKSTRPKSDASDEPSHVINIEDIDYSTPPREDGAESLNPSTNTDVADSAIITLYDAELSADVVFDTIPSDLDSTFPKDTGFNRSADAFGYANSLFIAVPDALPKEEDHHREESIASTDDFEEEKRVINLPREGRAQLKKKNLNKPERWIMHYCSSHSILLVGEGDFSFSTCLSKAFRKADNMVATSLNSKEFLQKNYSQAISNISKLKSRGCKVIHNVDATEMASYDYLKHVKFHRIVYNFPLAGFFRNESRKQQLRRNKELVGSFLMNAKQMVAETGEIHITHKSNGFFLHWNFKALASENGLRLIEEVKFNLEDYPGYFTKYGFGGDKNFNCQPSKTYKFQLT